MSCGLKMTSINPYAETFLYNFFFLKDFPVASSVLGSFLFLNESRSPSPVILSPWLRSSNNQCVVQVAVYNFFQQHGEYIARVLPIDESSSEILSVQNPEKHG